MCVTGVWGSHVITLHSREAPSLGLSENPLAQGLPPLLSWGSRVPPGTLQAFPGSTVPVSPEHGCV